MSRPFTARSQLRLLVTALALAATASATTLVAAQAPALPPPGAPPADTAVTPAASPPAPHVPRSRLPFNAPGPEQVARRVQAMDDEVKLTPAQRTKVTAAYQAEADGMIAINTKYAGADTATDQRRAKFSEMRALNQDTQAKLATILTPAQAAQWTRFVHERRDRNRRTLRHDAQRPAAQSGTPAAPSSRSGAATGGPPAGSAPK